MVMPAAKAARNPLPCTALSGGERGECDAERVERFVVATHAEALSDQIERRHGHQPDQYSRARPENEQF